jgi:GNAT superfamily N-acetyltransferase
MDQKRGGSSGILPPYEGPKGSDQSLGVPGAAEAAMGQGRTPLQIIKDSAAPVAMGAAVAAPIMSAGASLPVQALVGAASGGAQSKLTGGSNKQALGSAAIGGALPFAAEGVGRLAGAAKNYISGEINEAKDALTGSAIGESAKPPNPSIVENTYAKKPDLVAASLRSAGPSVDLPATANTAHPAIEEAMADAGHTAKDFQGRNGPAVFSKVVDHAIDIGNQRADAVIAPIRSTAVPPEILAQNPELAARFTPEQQAKGLNYGDLHDEKVTMNKELRAGHAYSQAPSAQFALQDPLANTRTAVEQARNLVYGKAQQVTGIDLRPMMAQESAAIKIGDVAESTKNTLSQQAAKQGAATVPQKLLGGMKKLISIKANPTNAFEPSLGDPTKEFNRNMQRAFADVKSTPGSVMKNGRLLEEGPGVLTNPNGVTPPEPNRQTTLPLTPGEHGFQLMPPAGQTPPAPGQQMGIPGIGRGGADLHVPPQPTLPAPLAPAAAPSTSGPQVMPDQLRSILSGSQDPAMADLNAQMKGRQAELAAKYPVQPLNPKPAAPSNPVNVAPMSERPGRAILGIKVNGVRAGQMSISPVPELGNGAVEMSTSQLGADFQGKGHGTEAYNQAIDYAKSKGAKTIFSDDQVKPGAANVWESLAKKGVAVWDPVVNRYRIKL